MPNPAPSNPCDENIDLAIGKPVKAFTGQDHQAHVQVHLDFAQSPFLGQSVAMAPNFMANCLNHIQDHLLTYYQELMKQAAGLPQTPEQLPNQPQITPPLDDNSPQAAEALAKSSAVVSQAMQLAFGKIPPLMQAARQQIIANTPKPPQDPMAAIAAQKVQGQQQIEQGKLSLAQQKAQGEGQAKIAQAQGRMQEAQAKLQEAQQDYNLKMQQIGIDAQTEIQTTDMTARAGLQKAADDNKTAVQIAAMKIAADHATHLIDGMSLSSNPKEETP